LSADPDDNRLVRAQRRLDQATAEPARARRGLLSWLAPGLRGGATAATR
jgi:hypothetical protein